jgi:hypothetical protein
MCSSGCRPGALGSSWWLQAMRPTDCYSSCSRRRLHCRLSWPLSVMVQAASMGTRHDGGPLHHAWMLFLGASVLQQMRWTNLAWRFIQGLCNPDLVTQAGGQHARRKSLLHIQVRHHTYIQQGSFVTRANHAWLLHRRQTTTAPDTSPAAHAKHA